VSEHVVDQPGLVFGLPVRHEWLTKQEAADYARVSVSTIERAIRAGELRAAGTAGRVLIRREWVDEWIEGRMRGPTG
jgi:excisionase family DNA binding protein